MGFIRWIELVIFKLLIAIVVFMATVIAIVVFMATVSVILMGVVLVYQG